MEKKLTTLQAFFAMTLVLDKFYLKTHSDDVGLLLSEMQLLRGGGTFDPATWDYWIESINKVKNKENIIGDELTSLQAFTAMRHFLEIFREETNSEDVGIILNTLLPLENGTPVREDVWKEWEIYISKALHEQCSSLCDCPKYEEKKEKKLAAQVSFYTMMLLLEEFYSEAFFGDVKVLLEKMQSIEDWNVSHPIREEWLDCFYKVLREDKRIARHVTPLQAFRAMRYFLELYNQKANSKDIDLLLNTHLQMENDQAVHPNIWNDWQSCIIQAFHAYCTLSCDCPDLPKEKMKFLDKIATLYENYFT